MINRTVYLNRLIERKDNGMIKVITGIRRCGKSYLLNNIFYSYLISCGITPDHIIKFAFDSEENLNQIGESMIDIYREKRGVNPEKFIKYINEKTKEKGKYYLLLDEIQFLDVFEAVLNSFLRRDNLDIYVTGSNSKFLSSDIITEFRGRGDEVRVYPLTFKEFSSKYEGEKYLALREYMLYGGLPEILEKENEEQKITFLKGLHQNVYFKDILRRYDLKHDDKLEIVSSIIASQIGSLTNPSKLANTFLSSGEKGLSDKTIVKYLDFLSDSFLVERVERYDIKRKKYIGSPYKYYYVDPGLRNAVINFRQYEETHIMENIIYNELKVRGYSVDVGLVKKEENENGKRLSVSYEVDFVCNLGSKRVYIKSALNIPDREKELQEERSLVNISDSFKKIIVVNSLIPKHENEEGITIISLLDFLLDDNII